MPQEISEAMVNGLLGETGSIVDPSMTTLQDLGSSVPHMSALAGWKALRGSGTIIHGGSGVGQPLPGSALPQAKFTGRLAGTLPLPPGAAIPPPPPGAAAWKGRAPGGLFREGIKQANYANPKNWTRFGTQDYFHHTGKLAGSGVAGKTPYNPFYLSAAGNAIARKTLTAGTRMGDFMVKHAPSLALQEGEEAFSKGGYARMAAGSRIGMMSDATFARTGANTYNFLTASGMSADAAQAAFKGGKHVVGAATAMSGAGYLSGRMGGFMFGAGQHIGADVLSGLGRGANVGYGRAAAMASKIGLGVSQGTRHSAGRMLSAGFDMAQKAFAGGHKMAGFKAAGRGTLLAGARVGSYLLPGVNVAMALWAVHDLARLGTKAVGHTARLGVEAFQDFNRGLNTGIMENNFTDTEATMTSRARGVQAIQNSRLNARSILGSEAGSMHAHFG